MCRPRETTVFQRVCTCFFSRKYWRGGRAPLGTPPNKKNPPMQSISTAFVLVDIPTNWDPRASQSHTMALTASLRAAALFESHWVPHQIKKVRCFEQRTFWWGAQWDSNPRSPDPQSGALTDYAMGTTSMRPKGLEPPAHCLEGSCSIHLSYGRTLLSHWVPLWRQLCVGTRCEKYNTIWSPFCQA